MASDGGKAMISVVLMAALLAQCASAASYVVGDDNGWTFPPLVDYYDSWAKQHTFHVGDTLEFNYDSLLHNVFEVSKSDLESCALSNPIATYDQSNAKITLTRSGYYGFICGVIGHCLGNMKMNIEVLEANSPSGSPSDIAPPGPPPPIWIVRSPPPPSTTPNPSHPPPPPPPSSTTPSAPSDAPSTTPMAPKSSRAPAPGAGRPSQAITPEAAPSPKKTPKPVASPAPGPAKAISHSPASSPNGAVHVKSPAPAPAQAAAGAAHGRGCGLAMIVSVFVAGCAIFFS